MELFVEDVSFIKKDINILREEIHRGHNLSKKSSIIYSLDVLENLYNILTDDDIDIKSVCKNKFLINKVNVRDRKMYNKVLGKFINNKDEHYSFMTSIFNDEKDVSFPCSVESLEDNFLKDDDIYKIVSEFFLSSGDLCGYQTFENLIKNKKIYLKNIDDSGFSGVTFFNTFMQDDIIVLNEENISNSVDLMTTLVHEIGHVIDYKKLGDKEKTYYNAKSILTETLSSFYEKQFLDYLIDNSIYKRKATSALTDFYFDMYDDINTVILFCNIPDNLIIKEKYKNISIVDLYEAICKQADVLVPIDEIPEPFTLDLIEGLEYGYGKALATYFSRLKKIDKKRYQDEYSKFMGLRTDYFPINFLEKLGTTSDFLGKTIDDDIIKSPCKIIIKK